MNLFKKTCVMLAVGASVLAAGGASAATRINGAQYIDNGQGLADFLGSYNPSTSDVGSWTHTGLGGGAFSDWLVFEINPAGLATLNAIFIPGSGVSNFQMQFYTLANQSCTANTFTTTGVCTQVAGDFTTLGPVVTPSPSFVVNLPFQLFTAGFYAVNVSGLSNNGTCVATDPQCNSYLGQITTTIIPEPGTLALAALGLLAAGAGLRRRAA